MRMKRSGRVSLVLIAAVAIVAAVVALFMLAGDSPSGVAGRFLSALAKGDTKTLAELSYMEGLSQSQIEAKWKATHDSSKYWVFAYAIKDVKEQDANNATVNLDWVKDKDGANLDLSTRANTKTWRRPINSCSRSSRSPTMNSRPVSAGPVRSSPT